MTFWCFVIRGFSVSVAGSAAPPKSMQALSGFFFSLALVLAVMFGGQTLDYTWGPALIALAVALLTACPAVKALGRPGPGTGIAWGLLAAACGWILWRCWGSPVKEFARSDALLVGGLLAGWLWIVLMPVTGAGVRVVMAALGGLAMVNLGIGLVQLRDPAFAWPFASRPAGLPSGLFGHYNHLADFSLVIAVILGARMLWARDTRWERVFQGAGTLAAAACVVLSGSRGGALSLGVAVMVLVGLAGLIAWRDKAKNRGVLIGFAVIIPVLLGLLGPFALGKVQERRGGEAKPVSEILDDRFRLLFIRAAIDISTSQPLSGSGSRSFGWRKNAVWQPDQDGMTDRFNDDFVHNELLQAAVDYGWIGAGLVVAAAFGIGLTGVAGLAGGGEGSTATCGALDAACCGGLAAMAGTLTHSNFSFVTHTLPGAVYLGLAFGLALPWRGPAAAGRPGLPVAGMAVCLLAIPLSFLLGHAGTMGTRAYAALWPAFFSRESAPATPPEVAVERVKRAMEIWPGAELAGLGGHLCREAADRESLPAADRAAWLDSAADLYGTAERLNPHDPEWAINRANLLSLMGRNEEAERCYESAVILQGGMERNFWARYHFAAHLYRRWYLEWTRNRRAGEALGQFIRARELLRESSEQGGSGYRLKETRELMAGLEKTIRFLEGAKVVPEPVR